MYESALSRPQPQVQYNLVLVLEYPCTLWHAAVSATIPVIRMISEGRTSKWRAVFCNTAVNFSVTMLCLSVQEAKLLDAKSRNNMYFIEYTVKKPSQEEKHLLSAIALGFNGRQAASALSALCPCTRLCEVYDACWCRHVACMLHTKAAVLSVFAQWNCIQQSLEVNRLPL